MARLEKIGAFGLTEPAHGTDVVKLETTARRGRRLVRAQRLQEVDRQRDLRRLRDHLGPRGGRARGRLRGRKGHTRVRRPGHQGKTALRCVQNAADLPHRRPGARREPAGRTSTPSATPRKSCWPRASAWPGRRSAPPSPATRRRWPTPSSATSSGCRWPPSSSSSTGCPGCWRTSPTCCSCSSRLSQLLDEGKVTMPEVALAKMHNTATCAGHPRRRPRPARRQRHRARLPRRPAPVRHRGDRHLRGHRHGAGADRRPRHHRKERLRSRRPSYCPGVSRRPTERGNPRVPHATPTEDKEQS